MHFRSLALGDPNQIEAAGNSKAEPVQLVRMDPTPTKSAQERSEPATNRHFELSLRVVDFTFVAFVLTETAGLDNNLISISSKVMAISSVPSDWF